MPLSICFVCLGNICRSPTAEGIMRKLVDEHGLSDHIVIDSAGTGAYHVGEPADVRSRSAAALHDVELTSISRRFVQEDFDRFDYVVAMDRANHRELSRLAAQETHHAKVHMLRKFDPDSGDDESVPDPYYNDGFDRVFDICMAGCQGLLAHLERIHGLRS